MKLTASLENVDLARISPLVDEYLKVWQKNIKGGLCFGLWGNVSGIGKSFDVRYLARSMKYTELVSELEYIKEGDKIVGHKDVKRKVLIQCPYMVATPHMIADTARSRQFIYHSNHYKILILDDIDKVVDDFGFSMGAVYDLVDWCVTEKGISIFWTSNKKMSILSEIYKDSYGPYLVRRLCDNSLFGEKV